MKTTVRDSAEAGLAARAATPPTAHAGLDLPALDSEVLFAFEPAALSDGRLRK